MSQAGSAAARCCSVLSLQSYIALNFRLVILESELLFLRIQE